MLLGNDGARVHLIARARAHGLRLRWSPHWAGKARMLCEAAGKAFVQLSAGYRLGPILDQVGRTLGV